MQNKGTVISVGIMFSPVVKFRLYGKFTSNGTLAEEGAHSISIADGTVLLDNTPAILPLSLEPCSDASFFELTDVTIGINFHWQRHETQRFRGELKFIEDNGLLTAINILPLEKYLESVISSEMNAESPEELLKAHAVISRSWLLAQREKRGVGKQCRSTSPEERIEWWDREDHNHFDVCADDHCQRYQGISKDASERAALAVNATAGEVLTFGGTICDARFSKCCGGVTEKFESAWEDEPHPYLTAINDSVSATVPNLQNEAAAEAWITGETGASFCNTGDKRILGTVLNGYDLETPDFYRWKVHYSAEELSALVSEKLGTDFGTVTALIPMERGTSGRIVKLKIEGTERSQIIGKELLIRKVLSHTHLYSSAFVVKKENSGFTLYGAGWGHGVGLCQIGAAVMAVKGYGYKQILAHYFPGTSIEKIY